MSGPKAETLMPLKEAASLPALHVSGDHIGQVVSFRWTMPEGKVSALVMGELRQIYHTGGETVLNLTSHEVDAGGSLAEFALDPELRITFWEAK